MKKSWFAIALLGLAVTVSATEDNAFYGGVNKFTRGVVNVVTGWVEIPAQIYKGYQKGFETETMITLKSSPAASRSIGALNGFFRGIGHAAGRTVWGVAECATFWAKDPLDNRNMLFLVDGEYAWSKGEPKPFCCPLPEDGLRKVGFRATRGLDDLFFGVSEIPCQTMVYWEKYDSLTMKVLGPFDGLWLGTSRMFNGAFELGLCLLPSPEERLQIPYDANHYFETCEQYNRNCPRLAGEK
jgi:putative exosortase-associated protein (TIGR04073 family)